MANDGIPQILSTNPTNHSFNIYTNPFRAQRLWPPDFSKIDPKHQFRLERRYRRRAKLKWARPRWTKAVKIAQYSSVVCGLHAARVRQCD